MTKEIVELPDRKSGDINEIRDKKIALAKDATTQSDLPQQLEYLIKNGQTGEFMNVLDSYINEKIRSALGGLIASLDKGAAGTTKAIACIDTNNDLGIINPANLASVLGDPNFAIWDISDINNPPIGFHILIGSSHAPTANMPTNNNGYIGFSLTKADNTVGYQMMVLYTTSGSVKAYYRYSWGNWPSWTALQ